MLRSLGLAASKLLAPQREAIEEVRAALDADWREAAAELLGGSWRDQVTAAAAVALGAAREVAADRVAADRVAADRVAADRVARNREAAHHVALDDAVLPLLWRAIDGASWVAPQLVAAALIADPQFESRAARRLGEAARRAPKTIGALVRAYTRCPTRRMPVMAQLGVHDRTLATEEARIGVRGVDGWLDYFAPTSRSS